MFPVFIVCCLSTVVCIICVLSSAPLSLSFLKNCRGRETPKVLHGGVTVKSRQDGARASRTEVEPDVAEGVEGRGADDGSEVCGTGRVTTNQSG